MPNAVKSKSEMKMDLTNCPVGSIASFNEYYDVLRDVAVRLNKLLNIEVDTKIDAYGSRQFAINNGGVYLKNDEKSNGLYFYGEILWDDKVSWYKGKHATDMNAEEIYERALENLVKRLEPRAKHWKALSSNLEKLKGPEGSKSLWEHLTDKG